MSRLDKFIFLEYAQSIQYEKIKRGFPDSCLYTLPNLARIYFGQLITNRGRRKNGWQESSISPAWSHCYEKAVQIRTVRQMRSGVQGQGQSKGCPALGLPVLRAVSPQRRLAPRNGSRPEAEEAGTIEQKAMKLAQAQKALTPQNKKGEGSTTYNDR